MGAVRAIVLGGSSLFAMATSAFAQQAPADKNGLNEDSIIIVEARRRDEDMQDVPLTVNAVTAETIQKLNIRSFQEITSVVPGLSLTANANGVGSSSSMRGVNQDVNATGENGTIQFYFNDAPVGSNFVLQAMYDIGQVEVLRGPQGTLRGRSTPSGSITVAPRKPNLSEVGATISGTLANHGTQNLQFGINVPMIRDILGIRVAGLYDRNRANHVRSLNSSIDPLSETQSIRASVLFEPADWLHAGFVYEGLDANSRSFDQVQSFANLQPGFTPGVDQTISTLPPGTIVASPPLVSPRLNDGTILPEDRLSTAASPRTVAQNFKFYGWNASVDFAGQSLIYVGSRTEATFKAHTNQDAGVTFPAVTLAQDLLTAGPNTSHEVRLQNQERVAGIFDYVVGYFRQTGGSETSLTQATAIRGYFPVTRAQDPRIPVGVTTLVAVTGAISNPTPIYVSPGHAKEESFFGNLVAHIGEGTEISGGLRRIQFSNHSDGIFIGCTKQQYQSGSPSCVSSRSSSNQHDVHKTIYNASVRHRFNEGLMVYAMTGTSARPPVRAVGDFSTAPTTLEVSHTSLPMETSTSYEIGLKSDWLDKKLQVNLTAYHQTYKNYPFRPSQGIYFVNVNSSGQEERGQFNFVTAVPVRVNGIESDITFTPSRYFRISATTNYVDSKIKNAMLACTDVNGDGIPDLAVPTLTQLKTAYGSEHLAQCPSTGQSATFLPKLSGSVQAEAMMPVASKVEGYVRGLLSWKGKSSNDPSNPYDNVGAYGLVNLFAGLRASNGSWEISAYAKNIFDTTKIVSADSSPFSTSLTYVNLATFKPFGTASYQSYYSAVSVTPPREVGVTLRFSLGAR